MVDPTIKSHHVRCGEETTIYIMEIVQPQRVTLSIISFKSREDSSTCFADVDGSHESIIHEISVENLVSFKVIVTCLSLKNVYITLKISSIKRVKDMQKNLHKHGWGN